MRPYRGGLVNPFGLRNFPRVPPKMRKSKSRFIYFARAGFCIFRNCSPICRRSQFRALLNGRSSVFVKEMAIFVRKMDCRIFGNVGLNIAPKRVSDISRVAFGDILPPNPLPKPTPHQNRHIDKWIYFLYVRFLIFRNSGLMCAPRSFYGIFCMGIRRFLSKCQSPILRKNGL